MAAASSTSAKALGLLLTLAALACNRSEAAPAGQSAAPKVTGHETAARVAAPRVESSAFLVEMHADGAYTAGASGNAAVTITPKGGYHVNAEYPYKFKLDPPPEGVSFPKPALAPGDGTFEAKKGAFAVPFVAAKAGTYTLAGTLSMSVCSDENCIIEKLPLKVDALVK